MDKMEIKVLNKDEQAVYYDEILRTLVAGDEEFVPPLSARSSTTQAELDGNEKSEDGILKYFEEMKTQRIMVATEGDKLLAFVSFRENYKNDEISDVPNIYLSTLIVKPETRGMGVTRKMYTELFDLYKSVSIFTRTWSTNLAHIKILAGFGFETLCTLENHRGNGIDTVYFVKRPN